MRAQVLKFIVQPVVIDVDDAGEIVGQVPTEITPGPWEFIGRRAIETELTAKLAELDALLAARTASLNEQRPNRQQRRSRPRRGRR